MASGIRWGRLDGFIRAPDRMRVDGVTLYCGWEDCGCAYPSQGLRPAVCPQCRRVEKWTILPPRIMAHPYVLSENDRKFLRSLRISAE